MTWVSGVPLHSFFGKVKKHGVSYKRKDIANALKEAGMGTKSLGTGEFVPEFKKRKGPRRRKSII